MILHELTLKDKESTKKIRPDDLKALMRIRKTRLTDAFERTSKHPLLQKAIR
jgi:hypothetical protein